MIHLPVIGAHVRRFSPSRRTSGGLSESQGWKISQTRSSLGRRKQAFDASPVHVTAACYVSSLRAARWTDSVQQRGTAKTLEPPRARLSWGSPHVIEAGVYSAPVSMGSNACSPRRHHLPALEQVMVTVCPSVTPMRRELWGTGSPWNQTLTV